MIQTIPGLTVRYFSSPQINDLVIFFFMAFANAYLIIPFLVFITIVIGYRKLYIQTARVIETLEGVAKR